MLRRGGGLSVLLAGLLVWAVHAQAPPDTTLALQGQTPSGTDSAQWELIADGKSFAWAPVRSYSADSVRAAAQEALLMLQRQGYYFAHLDSARIDSSHQPPTVHLFATRGEQVPVGEVCITGHQVLDEAFLRERMRTRPGRPLDPEQLERDLAALLQAYDDAGYPLAQVFIEDITVDDGEAPSLHLVLRIEEGGELPLLRVEVVGAERTMPAYVARVAGLRVGQPMRGYDPVEIQRRLQATSFFREVGMPELLLEPEGGAVLRIPLDEEPPGSFDLVLGYLPPPDGEGRGSLIGNGHLVLRNLFGDGRVLALKLNRLPDRVSSVDARAADPYVLGLPFSAEVQFEGIQQDTLYGQQRYRAALGYRFSGGLHLLGTLSREVTRPGQGGVALVQGRQRVPRSSAWFYGLEVRYERLDNLVNPRRGLLMETSLERGRKERSLRRVTVEQDTTFERTALRQERLQARVRAFVPTWRRQVVAVGGDAALLLSNEYDQSDLFRFGGATSLRGYDEERFLGRFVARALAEYRYQLDRRSYAFLFFDLGYVEQPELADFEAQRGFHPGYGFGIQFSTDIGLINASYAMSPEDGPTNGRVHVGLSVGL